MASMFLLLLAYGFHKNITRSEYKYKTTAANKNSELSAAVIILSCIIELPVIFMIYLRLEQPCCRVD
ncbi:hypothetical protein, partial [uncultured Megasphaera sp.]|uniref:hypothetical protein n=1 Tax=uncultured Megasphaera sp. TaxID=165188 RepID=UPI0026599678